MPTLIKLPKAKEIEEELEDISAEAPTPTFKTASETLLATTQACNKDELFGCESSSLFLHDPDPTDKIIKSP